MSPAWRALAAATAVGIGGFLLAPWVGAAPADRTVDPSAAVTFPVERATLPTDALLFPVGNADASVVDDGETVVLQADVFFAYDDATLSERAHSELASLAGQLRERAPILLVTGHTDADGTDAHNLDLSRRRAEAVRATLVSLLPGVTIRAEGRGEAEPVADNDTPEGRAQNRRVTITVAG